MQPPYLPSQWDIFTVDGLRLLDAEIACQAMAIGFLNDFKLIFIGVVISVPLVALSQAGLRRQVRSNFHNGCFRTGLLEASVLFAMHLKNFWARTPC